ncbi:MAG: hypothetical protein KatS3mg011_0869 [Acidimicrobiia bacterium]|nr:MAG: hypothetical protein KatS3mg011_0869 [Acidimicrobiia bacterium]
MSGVTTVALVGLLAGVLLLVLALLVWQEARSRRFEEGPVYVVEDAVRFIADRLDPEIRARLGRSDIRRIIQWELHYLQGLAQEDRRRPVEVVAGGAEPAVEYIASQISETHGVAYSLDDIRAVLRGEAEYLSSIGAVGDPVTDERGEP